MKKLVMMLAMVLFLSPAFGFAADIRNAETVGKDEKVSNLYLAGQNPTVDASVTGDLVVVGGVVTINGDVSGGVLAAGGTLNVKGAVKESLRVAGGTVNVEGTVGGDVVIFGGNIVLGTKSVVTGDVIVFGGTLDLKGNVMGSVKSSFAGNVNLTGNITGDVDFTQVGMLVVTSEAVIGGSLKYASQTEGTVSSSARIGGKTEFTQVVTKTDIKSFAPSFGSILFSLLMAFVTILVFITLFPKFAQNMVNNVLVSPWAKLGIGFLGIVVTPIALFLLAITVFGLGTMGYLLMAYFAFIALSGTLSAVFAGSYAWKLVRKEQELVVNWQTAAVGVVLVAVAKFIPIIGWLAALVLFFMVFGTLVTMSYNYIKTQRA